MKDQFYLVYKLAFEMSQAVVVETNISSPQTVVKFVPVSFDTGLESSRGVEKEKTE